MAMSTSRRRLLSLLPGLALFPALRASAHGVSLDLHHPLPAESAFHKEFLAPWVQKVEAEAGGRVRFHPHASSTLGGSAESLYDQARDGGTDVVWGPVRVAADHLPALTVLGFPFMVRSATGASRAASEYARINDLADRDFDGTRVIAVHVGDPGQLHWSRAPEGSDPVGRRVAIASTADGAVLAAMGATPVETDPARMAEALQAGTVDGVVLPWSQLAPHGVDPLARAHTEFGVGQPGLSCTVYVFAVSAGSFRGLADDLKAVFDGNSGTETAAWLGRVMDTAAARARKAAVDRGDVIRVVTADERGKWQQAARTAIDAQARALERGGVKIKRLLESAREQLGDYDKAPR